MKSRLVQAMEHCASIHSQQHVFQHACVGVTGSVGGNRKPAPATRPGECEAMVCNWYVTPQARAMVCNNFSLNGAFTNLHQYTMKFHALGRVQSRTVSNALHGRDRAQ